MKRHTFMKEKEQKILELLREDARITCTDIAEKLDLPISTAFDALKRVPLKVKTEVWMNLRNTRLSNITPSKGGN